MRCFETFLSDGLQARTVNMSKLLARMPALRIANAIQLPLLLQPYFHALNMVRMRKSLVLDRVGNKMDTTLRKKAANRSQQHLIVPDIILWSPNAPHIVQFGSKDQNLDQSHYVAAIAGANWARILQVNVLQHSNFASYFIKLIVPSTLSMHIKSSHNTGSAGEMISWKSKKIRFCGVVQPRIHSAIITAWCREPIISNHNIWKMFYVSATIKHCEFRLL